MGISPKLLYRWQQAQLIAEVGSVEGACDSEGRQLRAQRKRAEQELDIKKALVIFGQHQYIAQRAAQVPVRHLCQVLRVATSAYYAWQWRLAPEAA